MSDTTTTRLVRIWDRNYNLRGQAFLEWNGGTFTVAREDPIGIELWDHRELGHQVAVEGTDELAWWIDRMYINRTNGSVTVHCRPYLDVLRDSLILDAKLVELWLLAEKKWESSQPVGHAVTRINDGWYECDTCGATGSEAWAIGHQFPSQRSKRSLNWSIDIGDGPPIPMSEFTFGDRFPPRDDARDKLNAKVMQTINSRFDVLYDRDGKMLPHNWFEHPDRATKWATGQRVARTMIGDIVVSTVWLMGIDHEWQPGRPPLIFETMIFGRGDDDDCRRYSTEEQALRGHIEAVDRIRAGLAPFRDDSE
jgi:hypothetical protein